MFCWSAIGLANEYLPLEIYPSFHRRIIVWLSSMVKSLTPEVQGPKPRCESLDTSAPINIVSAVD
jgi:hypothetical protein